MTNVKCRNKSEGPNSGIRKPNGRELSHAEPAALDYNHDATEALAAAKCFRSAPSLFVIRASSLSLQPPDKSPLTGRRLAPRVSCMTQTPARPAPFLRPVCPP